MLKIYFPMTEAWDSAKEEFVTIENTSLELEHSLVSISKWESIWEKPFLNTKNMSYSETISYIKCMTLNKNVDENVYRFIDKKVIERIYNYMNKPMTATVINRIGKKKHHTSRTKTITSEEIYYNMMTLGIYMECEKWHINRLLTLIQIFEAKNRPQESMSQDEIARQYYELNKKRKQQLNTKG